MISKTSQISNGVDLAKIIDQTFLKKGASSEKIKELCQEAKKYGFRGFCVLPEHTKIAKECLKGSGVKVITLIDEPTGASSHQDRMKMAQKAEEARSDEIDVVMKIDAFKNGKYEEVLADLKEICQILPTKAIIGSGYLTDEEIKKASEIVKEAGAICVKTATSSDPLGSSELSEKAKHISIMKKSASSLLIKASGGIRTLADVKMMLEAGADIIGTSSGVEIMNEVTGVQPLYISTIGLEIHIELKTKSKMFCSCLNNPNEKQPNVNVCPICLGHPGTLPVINEEAVRKVIKTGLALNCQISEYSKFDRKNYFYPDLPKGYQISQLYQPFCKNGYLETKNSQKIRIREVHLEEDTGKLLHLKEEDHSLVDFNRAGIPLMELVTEPDIASAEEAREFAENLHLIMHYLDVSDADMEKGEMRVEVNISLSAGKKLGTKVEIKNLNSFRSVERGIDYEIKRQQELLESGKKVVRETRGWDDVKEITVSQREKEEAHDYRYFPEPDLPPLHFTEKEITEIKAEIPELPQQKKERFAKEYKLDEESIDVLVCNKMLGEYFEKAANFLPLDLVKMASDFLINAEVKNYNIPPKNFSQLIALIKNGKISRTAAKEILLEIVDKDPRQVIKGRGLEQLSDEKGIEKIVKEVISQNKKAVGDYKSGKINALQFLTGQIMAITKGRAHPELTRDILKKLLG